MSKIRNFCCCREKLSLIHFSGVFLNQKNRRPQLEVHKSSMTISNFRVCQLVQRSNLFPKVCWSHKYQTVKVIKADHLTCQKLLQTWCMSGLWQLGRNLALAQENLPSLACWSGLACEKFYFYNNPLRTSIDMGALSHKDGCTCFVARVACILGVAKQARLPQSPAPPPTPTQVHSPTVGF